MDVVAANTGRRCSRALRSRRRWRRSTTSSRRRGCATWRRSWRTVGPTTRSWRSRPRSRARCNQLHGTMALLREGIGKKKVEIVDRRGGRCRRGGADDGGRTGLPSRPAEALRRVAGAARPRVPAGDRGLGGEGQALRRGQVPVQGAGPGDRAGPVHRVAVAPADPEGLPAQVPGLGGRAAVVADGKRAGGVPVRCRSVPAQAAGRGPDADVLPARAGRSGPTGGFTTCRWGCRPSVCRPRSTR